MAYAYVQVVGSVYEVLQGFRIKIYFMGPSKNYNQEELKALRVQIDACIQVIESEQENGHEGVDIKNYQLYNMSSYQTEIKLREAKMWVGKMMEGMGSELPTEFRDQAPKA